MRELGSDGPSGSVVVEKPGMGPNRVTGKFSFMGEREFGSMADFVGEFWNLSSPLLSSSGGGVGVLGGRGIGRSVMVVMFISLYAMHSYKFQMLMLLLV